MDDGTIVTAGVAKQIADQIRAAIMEGRLNPNEKLQTEEELATRYGVSRPTIREALKRLAAQNLIRSKRGPGGGNFVNEASLEQVAPAVTSAARMLATLGELPMEEVFAARRELEGLCLRMTFDRQDPDLAKRLDAELVVQRDQSVSDQDFCASDVRFHRLIIDSCGNVIVRLALYTVVEALMPVINMIITRTRQRSEIRKHHVRMVEAIRRNNLAGAKEALDDVIAYRATEYAKVAKRR
jgi:DNA-binding FadR family transcriptional regulator